MDFETDPAQEFLNREREELGDFQDEIIPSNAESTVPVTEQITNDDFEMINNEVPSDGIADDLAGMTITNTSVFHEVPEKIKKWREEQQRKIEEKDAKEKEMIEKMREEAAKDLEDWYNQYRDTKEKTKTMNRSAEQDLSSSQTNGVAENTAIWEKISTLCDFGGNKGPKTGRDVTRMRSIFLQLKSSPPAAKNI